MPIPEPPRGLRRIAALGPGFLWMVSTAGSGELLFTPRVGALYGYSLLWAMVAAVSLKWVINREIEAIHIPIVTSLTLYLNRTRLTRALRPSLASVVATVLAGSFFLIFAVLYLRGLL